MVMNLLKLIVFGPSKETLNGKRLNNKGDCIDKKNSGVRIVLTDKNTEALEEKIKHVRTSNCSVNPSRLVNLILDIFFNRYFEKHEPFIQKMLFDRKKYMRSLLRRDLTEEELQRELKSLSRNTNSREPFSDDSIQELNTRVVAKDSDE